jgi:hypothetical protein
LAVFDDGNGPALYVGGSFDPPIWDVWTHTIAKWDGENWRALPQELGYYEPEIEETPVVRALIEFDDGSGPALFVGGCFATAGETVVNKIARWDGRNWSTLGAGIDHDPSCAVWSLSATVEALALFDNGKGLALYAGGEFVSAGGTPANYIARWDGESWSTLGEGVDGRVYSLTAFNDGSGPALFVGGRFHAVGSVPVSGIAKWNGVSWSALSSGLNGTVYALAVFDDGNGPALYAAVDHARSADLPASYVGKWDGQSWSLVGQGFSGDRGLRTLAVFDPGSGPELYAGGYFTRVGDVPAIGIAKWDGHSWADVRGSIGPPLWGNESIEATTVMEFGNGPRLVAAGYFRSIGGVSAVGIAQWDGVAWAPMGGPPARGLDGWVLDFTVGDDGTGPGLFAAGSFIRGGDQTLKYLGKWNGESWSTIGGGFDRYVNEITFFDDGGGPAIYAVGGFTVAGGQPANQVAKWNGSMWHPLGGGLGGRQEPVVTVTGVETGPAFGLYAGGFFRATNLHPEYLARWNGQSWEKVGGGVRGRVYALTSFDDGSGLQLYAGGFGVARWNGVSWSPLGNGLPGTVNKLEILDDTRGPALYACWDGGVSKWNGTEWVRIGSPGFGNGHVYAAAFFDDGGGPALYAAGYFFEINGVRAYHIAKWDGTSWSPLRQILYGGVLDLAAFDDGSGPALFAGGEFIRAGDTVSSHIAKWHVPRRQLPGDLDCDADADLNDFASLADCLGGPAAGFTHSTCRFADSDGDGDVDLADFAIFQNFRTPR